MQIDCMRHELLAINAFLGFADDDPPPQTLIMIMVSTWHRAHTALRCVFRLINCTILELAVCDLVKRRNGQIPPHPPVHDLSFHSFP